MLGDIDRLAKLQGIPTDGALAEASPGQFEINLHHTRNVLSACDHALQLKRLVRQVAENHGMTATFMAKPYEEYAGSGMHVHVSMLDAADHNAFACDDGSDSPLLKRALAGMIDLMPASMALLAPNVNAYRRFIPESYVPLQASGATTTAPWRCAFPAAISITAALSIASPVRTLTPAGDGGDFRRHSARAGYSADAARAGYRQRPHVGRHAAAGASERGAGRVRAKPRPARAAGERFSFVWHSCKHHELMQFERLITATEIDWMLKNA